MYHDPNPNHVTSRRALGNGPTGGGGPPGAGESPVVLQHAGGGG